MSQEARFIVISWRRSYLTVVVHFPAEVLPLRTRVLLAVAASIEHVATDLVVILEAFAVAVELGVFELRVAQLGQDLLPEATARLGHAGVDASALIKPPICIVVAGAELLLVLTDDLVDLASVVADLLRELVHLCRHVVREVRSVLLLSSREHRVVAELRLQLLHVAVVVEAGGLDVHVLRCLLRWLCWGGRGELLTVVVLAARAQSLDAVGQVLHLEVRA